MFGHHKRRREKRKLKQEREKFSHQKEQWEKESPQRQKEQEDLQRSQVDQRAQESRENRRQGYEEGRRRVQDLYNDPSITGLSDPKRKAMQYEANKAIQRSHQAANRKLLGDQSQRGIQGQGGVGYAQQRDLQRLAQEAQGGVIRDLDKLNEDMRLKHIAAIYAGEQGEATQYQLDKQIALDELKLDEERRRQRQFEQDARELFNRI